MHAQAVNNHNLANANTDGFRQALANANTVPVRGPVFDSRDYAQLGTDGTDFSKGQMQSTGRELDIAIEDEGFIAVQGPDGEEGYTRAGSLHGSLEQRLTVLLLFLAAEREADLAHGQLVSLQGAHQFGEILEATAG